MGPATPQVVPVLLRTRSERAPSLGADSSRKFAQPENVPASGGQLFSKSCDVKVIQIGPESSSIYLPETLKKGSLQLKKSQSWIKINISIFSFRAQFGPLQESPLGRVRVGRRGCWRLLSSEVPRWRSDGRRPVDSRGLHMFRV